MNLKSRWDTSASTTSRVVLGHTVMYDDVIWLVVHLTLRREGVRGRVGFCVTVVMAFQQRDWRGVFKFCVNVHLPSQCVWQRGRIV